MTTENYLLAFENLHKFLAEKHPEALEDYKVKLKAEHEKMLFLKEQIDQDLQQVQIILDILRGQQP